MRCRLVGRQANAKGLSATVTCTAIMLIIPTLYGQCASSLLPRVTGTHSWNLLGPRALAVANIY